jgi:hypothetical protein
MRRDLQGLELGWVVGIVEGEGYLADRNGRPAIVVAMTDEDIILRLSELTGVGNVTGPHPRKGPGWKPIYKWIVTARDDGAWLIGKMAPHLGARRGVKAREILDAYAAAGPTRGTADTCSYGHDISDDSKNLRRIAEGKYTKRRCLACQARRQREHRAREALRAAGVTG